jgi:hypothetical protein
MNHEKIIRKKVSRQKLGKNIKIDFVHTILAYYSNFLHQRRKTPNTMSFYFPSIEVVLSFLHRKEK